MKRVTEPLHAVLARSLLAFVATYVTLLSWRGLSEQSSTYLGPLFGAGLALLLGGALARFLGVPALVVTLGQVALSLAGLGHWLAPATTIGGWLPTGRTLRVVAQRLQGSVEIANQHPAPITLEDAAAFAPLMVLAGVGVFLLVDVFLGLLRRAPLVGLPLLAAFTAPVSVLGGVSWFVFAVAALAFVLMLAVDQALRLSRWGSALPASAPRPRGAADAMVGGPTGGAPTGIAAGMSDDQPHRVRVGTLWPAASRLAVAGVGLAVIAPALLPATSGLFRPGSGAGIGEGGLALDNPLVDMRRDLVRGEDVPLVRVQTTDPAPAYLRTTVLDDFDGETWRPSERQLPRDQRVTGELPPPAGLAEGTDVRTHRSRISVLEDFDTSWLPTPFPAQSVTVEGDWRYGLSTRDILSGDEDVDAGGLTYDAVGVVVEPDPARLVDAPPVPQSVYVPMTDLPAEVPSSVSQLAREVTEGGRSQFERAVLLQDFFREDGGFTYSLERSSSGSGFEQMQQFLGSGEGSRTGYCEQFASAMAIMARAVGIPARVAVGFLRPEPETSADGGSWVYSSHDLHSWPELYFEEAGWIRFEPTPRVHTDSAPAYTAGAIPAPSDDGARGSVQQDDATELPDPATTERDAPTPEAEVTSGGPSRWLLLLPGALLLGGLVAAPRALREWLRRRRLTQDAEPGQRVEGAWAELRATTIDLRLGWDDDATLRQRARALAQPVSGDLGALEALEGVVRGVERSRFSRGGVDSSTADAVVAGVVLACAALDRCVSHRARRRATWLPASLWRGRRRQVPSAGGPGAPSGPSAESPRSESDLVSV